MTSLESLLRSLAPQDLGWDQELSAEGIGLLMTALPSGAVGEYQLDDEYPGA